MARLTNTTTTVFDDAGYTSVTTGNFWSPGSNVSVDTQQALGGVLHLKFKMSTGVTGKTFAVYASYSNDDSVYDDVSLAQINKLGDVVIQDTTTSDQVTTLLIDPAKMMAKYFKVQIYNASGQTLQVRYVKASVRIPV
jgi:hypothetical protein